MNCKPGDLAFVSKGRNAGCIVEVIEIDMVWTQIEGCPIWECRSRTPILCADILNNDVWSTELSIEDSRLRPISGVPVDDETPVETNIPEALQLALGIQARVWA